MKEYTLYIALCKCMRERERERGREGGERERGREGGREGGRERERVTNYSNIRELTAPNTQITNRLITKEISKATPKERYISNMFLQQQI